MAWTDPAAPALPPQHFVLTVRPPSAGGEWHAWLLDAAGAQLEFDSPLELMRHLAQLGRTTPPPGGLR